MKFLIPLIVCLTIFACPVEKFVQLDEILCEDEAKQVLMAASVTIVMLLQAQMPKSSPSHVFQRTGTAGLPCA